MTINDLLDVVMDGTEVKAYNTDTEEETEPTTDFDQIRDELGGCEVASIDIENDVLTINY